MCGIAGAFDTTGERQFPRSVLSAMLAAIAHRGPDDEAAHHEPGLAIGARRLSILDLDGGRQPIANEDGSIRVAFNGELFEYPEMRERLLTRGHRLRTRCDTEAWVHLYEDYGAEMLEHARGQFAVSLWDSNSRRLLLARDRFGICPLYYALADGWLLWASEVRAIFASGLVQPEPDAKGIDYFFRFFSPPPERTFFLGVRMLAPGFLLEAGARGVSTRRYWDLNFPRRGEELRGEPASELHARLDRAVERRLRGDVPVACYISGGLDSSVVLGLASRLRRDGVASFSIGLTGGAGPDETGPASETANLLRSPLAIASMDAAAIAEAYPELVEAAEVPVLDTSCACMMRLAGLAHEHGFKVVLTGEGADEALAGYPWFKVQKFAAMTPFAPRTASHLISDVAARARREVYSAAMWEQTNGYEAWDELGLDWSRLDSWHPLNRSLYLAYKTTLAGMQLVSKGDRVAMHSSVETRYPYLDEDVVEFCCSMAPEYKLRRLTDKWALRQAAAKILPPQIAGRPKTMFRAKLAPTFLGPHRPAWVDQLLSAESLNRAGWFDPALIHRARLRRFGLRRTLGNFGLASVVAVQVWHHLWCGGGLCELSSLAFAACTTEAK